MQKDFPRPRNWQHSAATAVTFLLALLILNGSLSSGSMQAAPPMQTATDLCWLLPPGGEAPTGGVLGRTPIPASATYCRREYSDKQVIAEIRLTPSPAQAQADMKKRCDSLASTGVNCAPTDIGDAGFQAVSSLVTEYHAARGCYYFFTATERRDLANLTRDTLKQMDDKLKTLPPCPGAGVFSAGHGCSYNEANISLGQVRCAATSTNAPPNAEIAFRWLLDGAVQPETRNTFARDDKDLTPGEHTITVVAVDTKSRRESEATSFRFAKPGADLLVVVQCALRAGDDRAVACYAGPKNVPAGAVLTYEWTWNSVPEGETSRTLSKVGLRDGSYTVTVRAKDNRSGKTAQGSTAVQIGTPTQPAAAGSGTVEVTTPTGTIVLKPDERTTITLPTDRKAQIRARCVKVLNTILLMELVRYPGDYIPSGLTIDTAVVASLVKLECDKLLASAPRTLAMAGDLFGPSLALASAQEPAVQLNLELQQGSVRMVVVHEQVALDVKTATTAVASQGKNTFGVAYDPTSRTSIVTASQGTVSLHPQRTGASSFTLSAGKIVTVTQNSVSPIAPVPQGDTDTGGLVLLFLCGCLCLLGLAGLAVIVILITRRRRQPAPQNSTHPRNLPN